MVVVEVVVWWRRSGGGGCVCGGGGCGVVEAETEKGVCGLWAFSDVTNGVR